MNKTLLYLNEDLASSIALRYADYLSSVSDLKLYIIHVEEPDTRQQAGTGWVRRTWETGIQETGAQVVKRIIKTENVKCKFAGPPKVVVGDREAEILKELRIGGYDLFMEGHMNASSVDEFYRIVSSRLYKQASCPVMLVKNLTVARTAVILLGDAVDHRKVVDRYMQLVDGSKLDTELIYFKFRDQAEVSFMDLSEGGAALKESEGLLKAAGMPVKKSTVICGTPEHTGDFLRNYAFIAANLPVRKSLRMEVLANTPASVLLC